MNNVITYTTTPEEEMAKKKKKKVQFMISELYEDLEQIYLEEKT